MADQTVTLPDGKTLTFPDDMPRDVRNKIFADAFKKFSAERQAAEEADAPRTIGIPGVTSTMQMKPSTFRNTTDVGAEMAGGTLGALAGTPLGPEAAIAGAGLGAGLMKKGARFVQGKMGMNPEPYGLLEAAPDVLINAAGEGVFRIPFAGVRRLKGLMRAGADTKVAQANMQLLADIGVENPPLHMVLQGANPKFDFAGLNEWLMKNPFSAPTMRKANEDAARNVGNTFWRKWATVSPEGSYLLPDVEDAGEALTKGLKRHNRAWRDIGGAKYANVFSQLNGATPVSWSNTHEFLKNRAALDDILGALSSDKLKGLHGALNKEYVQEFTKTLPEALRMEIVRDMPFEQMKALRTEVGRKISNWDSYGDVAREDLKDLYGALTKDMRAAADKVGVLKEFDEANKYWADNLAQQEKVFDRLQGKLKSDAELGESVQRLVKRGGGQGDSQTILQLRESIGAGSEEWHTMRNYIMKEFGEGTDGQFNVMQLNKRWGRLTEKSKQALLPDKEARELLDKFITAVDKFGPEALMGPKRSILSRWTRAEMLGPVSGAMTLGALGGGLGWAATDNKAAGVGSGLAILGALSYITPRSAARLMTSRTFTKFATTAMGKTPEVVAGMISRLGANAATMEPDEQTAFMEFFGAMGSMMPRAGGK